MEQGIDFDDEENDFNAINSTVTKRTLRIESDSENEDVCDDSSNVKNNKLIESEHLMQGVEVEKERVNITEYGMEGVEEGVDVLNKEDENVGTKKVSESENDGPRSIEKLITENSDSDNELLTSSHKNTTKSVSKRLAIVDSDSEDSEDHSDTTKTVSKRLTAVHSDDSEVELPSPSENTNKDVYSSGRSTTVDECNPNGKTITEDNTDTLTTSIFQKSRLSALYDSESSEDENQVSYSETNAQDFPQGKQNSKSKKPKLPAKPKEKKMTAKEALQQRQEITSESQRMVRESRVSLPYHVPKARSIKEFLQNRPKFASSLSQNTCRTPPSLAMKMSVQQLEVITKKLEERSKEIQKFYESESESEEEAPISEPAHDEENPNEGNAKEGGEDLNVDVTANLLVNVNNQNEENLKEIDGDVNATIVPSEVNKEMTGVEENDGEVIQEMVSIQTEEMISLVMPDSSYEAETSNLNDLEVSTEITDIQNKTDLEHDSTRKSDMENKSNPILEDTSTEIIETEEIAKKKFLEDSGNSTTYDFNLDDLEESEGMVQPQPQEKSQESDITVEVQDRTVEDEHFRRLLQKYEGEPIQIVEKKMSMRELWKQKFGDTIPCLKGAPGEEIDLDDTGYIDGVMQLKERFIKHVTKQHVTKHKVQLNVVNLSQGEIHKETVAMSVDADEEPVTLNETPGLKLRKLKNELEMQMAQRRSELWKQRQSNIAQVESEEKADYENEAILDDEEEAELTDGDTTEGEMEDDENIIDADEESKEKCTFLDDQAEEDDEDEENTELNEVDQVDELNEDQEDGSSAVNENEETKEHDVTTPRKPRRLLIGNPENSDSDEEAESSFKNIADSNLSSTDTAEGDEFPPNVPFPNENEKTPSKSKSQFSFLTPVQHLTGLQNLNSLPIVSSKFINEISPSTNSVVLPEPSPCKENSFCAEDPEDAVASIHNSQASLAAQNIEKPASPENSPIKNTVPTTQDFLNICSGSFSIDCETQNNEGLKSQTLDNDTCISNQSVQPTQINLNIREEVKNLDEDNLITELLNEEELELFKKKFDSPLIPQNTESKMIVKSGRLVIDSSDEENEDTFEPIKKTKKKLDFSDDESDVESEEDEEEEIDLHENLSEDELEDEESSNVVMEYDSEENEIEVEVQEKTKSKSGVKSREFFENEAELSESDWDSEDEDEKGLDILETEQGDADVFDEAQVRNDLEKIHLRRVLDQDNQEIKMLQELLLEDGELHGTGRQKQFRWRNIDDMDNEEVRNDADVDVYLEEDESEEQWRKIRHEREMFLKNKTESSNSLPSDNLTESESDSQILKLGEEALRKGSSKAALEKSKLLSTTVEVTKPFAILNTRGSFLARSDQFLSKLAEINKVNTSVATKNAKKIVFETKSIDNEDTAVGLSNGKKRKGSEGTPYMIKKLRLSSNLSPNLNKVERKKQLFN